MDPGYRGAPAWMSLGLCLWLGLPTSAAATATFRIEDGSPDISVSEWVWSKRSPGTPIGWDVTDDVPPGGFENPIYRYDNYVWVQVQQLGTVDGDQDAYLHLFVGRAGWSYSSEEIAQPSNQFSPDGGWTLAQWEAELAQGKVARIPWFDGLATYPTVHLSQPAYRPGPGNTKWYQFKWEAPLVPPDSASSGSTYSLLAYVDDNKDLGTDFSVLGDDSVAERQLDVFGLDFSDAPDPTFPTLLASDGARHVATGPMLGLLRDSELDGQPTPAANGDDANDTDDDDGVIFTSLIVPGATATLEITASESALLNAWVDFDEDGDWSDAGEQVFTDEALAAGSNSLSFAVPASAAADVTPFARFRLNSAGALGPTGLASDGEVEDYEIIRDIDECLLGTDDCDVNARCANTAGGFTCSCIDGYAGDGVTCTDVDECASQLDNCSGDGTCSNTSGSFNCACNDGYTGDGVTCTDVDECAAGVADCDANAACANTDGAYECECNSGYEGDGTTCSPAADGKADPDAGCSCSQETSASMWLAVLGLFLVRRRPRNRLRRFWCGAPES